jgi:serine protease Do
MGSGVIVKSNGTILTNYHVIKEADDIQVKTTDGTKYDAEILGSDPKTDVAVIKIDIKNADYAPLGDSDDLKVGEWVLAIGNPFSEELRQTVTKGIVSAKGRKGLGLADGQGYENFIQTDAPINQGNSGGALINLHGEVIGINTAIVSPSGSFAGVGFAIPINMARNVMNQLITKGKVTRGHLGVWTSDVDEDMARAVDLNNTEGAFVHEVDKNSPADKAGIRPSDVIVKINDVYIKNSTDLKFLIADLEPGKTIDVTVIRNGESKKLSVILGELDEAGKSAAISEREIDDLGIEVENLTEDAARRYGYEMNSGILIARVDQTSVAFQKNLREGDLIREINRKKVTTVREFMEIMKTKKSGDTLLFYVQRQNSKFFAAIEIPE